MLTETQWLVVMGTKGTCKTSLATGLAHHLAKLVEGEAESEGVEEGGSRLGELLGNGGGVTTFNVDKQGLGVSGCGLNHLCLLSVAVARLLDCVQHNFAVKSCERLRTL